MPATLRSNAVSVLDLDYYKLTMLQFIWKHYADVPVTFRLHSRKQDLADIIAPRDLRFELGRKFSRHLDVYEAAWLRDLGVFEDAFIDDLARMLKDDIERPVIDNRTRNVYVSGDWFKVSLWETFILSAVSEQYSTAFVHTPDEFRRFHDIYGIGQSGAKWADFGTRRRFSADNHETLISHLAQGGYFHGFIGTSNVHFANKYELQPIGTYAHELEMVLRNYHDSEFDTTRDVLTKWQEMYPRELRIALTDTYSTSKFLEDHGRFLLENDWRGVRLDSGNPREMGRYVDEWLVKNCPANLAPLDVVFSDGLDANTIIDLQNRFGQNNGHPATFINPLFGWGTGLTNPNSDLSLVMKAVESNGRDTYKVTDDNTKSIGN